MKKCSECGTTNEMKSELIDNSPEAWPFVLMAWLLLSAVMALLYIYLREAEMRQPNNGNQDELLPHTNPHVEWDDENLIDNEGDFV